MEKFLEWHGGAHKAVVNILIIGFCLEPKLITVREKYQTKKQKYKNECEGRLGHFSSLLHNKSHYHKQQVHQSACGSDQIGRAAQF